MKPKTKDLLLMVLMLTIIVAMFVSMVVFFVKQHENIYVKVYNEGNTFYVQSLGEEEKYSKFNKNQVTESEYKVYLFVRIGNTNQFEYIGVKSLYINNNDGTRYVKYKAVEKYLRKPNKSNTKLYVRTLRIYRVQQKKVIL